MMAVGEWVLVPSGLIPIFFYLLSINWSVLRPCFYEVYFLEYFRLG
jgi:hypothetical protein